MNSFKRAKNTKILIFIFSLMFLAFVFSTALYAYADEENVRAPELIEKVETLEEFGDNEFEATASLSAITTYFSGGNGTESSPYIISSVADFKDFATFVNSGQQEFVKAHYKLNTDIDLSNAEWSPIGQYTNTTGYSTCFQGSFDGDGHKVSNF
ncbi:MAG: hypothetical protein J6036_03845, partial [Clostridia bacterium]|nr:hypothetical protein [Clostridia bacterium]